MGKPQTPAQKAANRTFHNREEAKKGKRASKAPAVSSETPETPKSVRNPKHKQQSKLGTGLIVLMVFLICGGAALQLLSIFSSRGPVQ